MKIENLLMEEKPFQWSTRTWTEVRYPTGNIFNIFLFLLDFFVYCWCAACVLYMLIFIYWNNLIAFLFLKKQPQTTTISPRGIDKYSDFDMWWKDSRRVEEDVSDRRCEGRIRNRDGSKLWVNCDSSIPPTTHFTVEFSLLLLHFYMEKLFFFHSLTTRQLEY